MSEGIFEYSDQSTEQGNIAQNDPPGDPHRSQFSTGDLVRVIHAGLANAEHRIGSRLVDCGLHERAQYIVENAREHDVYWRHYALAHFLWRTTKPDTEVQNR